MADPIPVPEPTDKERARFWAKVHKEPDGCWVWTAARFTKGYGAFTLRGKVRRAHRVAYVWENGELSEGYTGLDHICNRRECVNPAHLRPTLAIENVLRGNGLTAQNARREFCKNGHPLDYIAPGTGWRSCSICRKEASYRSAVKNRDRINARKREKRRLARESRS